MTIEKQKSNLSFKSLAHKSIVDRLVDQLTNAIINGDIAPGQKIPTELELASSFQVGRNSVREAIKVLEAFGVLNIKRSEGTFVCDEFNKRMLDPLLYGFLLQKDSIEIQDLRQVFDIGILHVAMTKVSEDNLKNIREKLHDLHVTVLNENFSAKSLLMADVAFHEAIVNSAQNQLLSNIAGYIDRITLASRIHTVQKIIDANKIATFIELHEHIVQVIEKRDSASISKIVEEHYQFWRHQMVTENDVT